MTSTFLDFYNFFKVIEERNMPVELLKHETPRVTNIERTLPYVEIGIAIVILLKV
jgi:hypothetical protein